MSSFEQRRSVLDRLAHMRESTVISYITGDRPQMQTRISPEIIDLFVKHLDACGPVKKLTLVLYTNGGDTAAAWRLINLLQTFSDELEVIIPAKALSAGTLISLGANRIVMTKQAALGPIDPSINHPLNPISPIAPHSYVSVSVEEVRGYLEGARKEYGASDAAIATLLLDLANKVHPLVLGQIFRSREQIRFLAKKLLVRQVQNEDQSAKIIDFLCAESGSHDYTINRREARELGLNIEVPGSELYALLSTLHDSYVEELKLLDPYDPFTLLGQDQVTSYTLPRAMIETTFFGSHQFISEGVLTKTTTVHPQPNGAVIQQDAYHDQRRFEGWRKA